MLRALNRERLVTMSCDSSDSGDLSMYCSVSSVEIEESEVLEVEGYLETVEPYQFEPVASDSSAESDTEAEDATLETKKGSTAETGKNLHVCLLKIILVC